MKIIALVTVAVLVAACHRASTPIAAPAHATVAATTHQAEEASRRAALAVRRDEMIGYLHEYRERGQYPVDAIGRPLSAFVDARGVRCPMAELIFRSGHPELVAAVAREYNAVRLADVHSGPLHDWMLGSGLTQEEMEMVQGAMEFDPQWRLEGAQLDEVQVVRREQDAQVRGRLETAERALRTGTQVALPTAVGRLPKAGVPAIAVKGPVLPAEALAKPAATPAPRRVGVRTP